MENIIYADSDQKHIVEILSNALDKAKKGEIISIAFCFNTYECETGNAIAIKDGANRLALLGELRLLERDLIDCFFQTRRQPAWEYCE